MLFILCLTLLIIYVFMKITVGLCKSSTCLLGKTAIVTGANSGLGYYTCLNLASRGCRVIMADVADMEKSKTNIITFTNNDNITTKKLDLASLQSVRDFVSGIKKTEPRLDILINNAGIPFFEGNKLEDDLNPVMQVNYFGHFLLTHLLIELLKKSAPSRIIFVSSPISFFTNLSIGNLNEKVSDDILSILRIYANSKLSVLIASDIFAEKLRQSGVTSNSVNPGHSNTQLLRKFCSKFQHVPKVVFNILIPIFCKSAWEGAQVSVYVAISKKMEMMSGYHFWECKPFLKPFKAYNKKFCKEIWDATEKLVKLAPNERL